MKIINITEEAITKLMKKLDISREEAIEVLRDDEDIEHGKEKSFDLTPEQLAASRKYKNEKRCVDAYGKTRTRTVKENKEKREAVAALADCLNKLSVVSDVNIRNAERYIDFKLKGVDCTITLTAHTYKKNNK